VMVASGEWLKLGRNCDGSEWRVVNAGEEL
jgi:hypothetical protein